MKGSSISQLKWSHLFSSRPRHTFSLNKRTVSIDQQNPLLTEPKKKPSPLSPREKKQKPTERAALTHHSPLRGTQNKSLDTYLGPSRPSGGALEASLPTKTPSTVKKPPSFGEAPLANDFSAKVISELKEEVARLTHELSQRQSNNDVLLKLLIEENIQLKIKMAEIQHQQQGIMHTQGSLHYSPRGVPFQEMLTSRAEKQTPKMTEAFYQTALLGLQKNVEFLLAENDKLNNILLSLAQGPDHCQQY